jgi:hypothetical protein
MHVGLALSKGEERSGGYDDLQDLLEREDPEEKRHHRDHGQVSDIYLISHILRSSMKNVSTYRSGSAK